MYDIYAAWRGKYHEAWDKSIYKVLPGRTASRYTFILDGETVQAKLK